MHNNQPQYDALAKISQQVKFAIDTYKKHGLSATQFSNVVIGGLGGSGIGGRIAKAWSADQFSIPVEVVSDYSLPAYANEKTLLIVGSYSGNTEETLEMYADGKARGCKMLVLSSGGKITELGIADGLIIYPLESGFQPRMALGYSLTHLVQIFGELIGKDFTEELNAVVEKLSDLTPYREDAEEIFAIITKNINKKIIVVADAGMEAIAIRFAQQVQENAKAEAFVHTLPEANHNVIESYYGQMDSVFLFVSTTRNERVGSRFEFLNSLLEVENNKVIHLQIQEYSLRSIYETIVRLDFVSLFMADQRMVDALNVPNIASLKEFLEE